MKSAGQTPQFNEESLSQIPALWQLINLGYQYLTPEQARAERNQRDSNVLLENILRGQLKKINRIRHKGGEYLFSEENIQSAIQKIKNIRYDGLQKTNEEIYDLITLGTSLEQTIDGDSKSFTLNYIDWKNPAANVFHVTAEFPVERSRSAETARPDIVLFVNGIPLVVIECKAPHIDVEKAVSQTIRNQGEEYIPRLFVYVQMVLAVNRNKAKYATAGTSQKFWSVWRESEDSDTAVSAGINGMLSGADKDALFSGNFASARQDFDKLAEQDRRITEQDRCLHSLCRPKRLLEMAHGFVVFESNIKKIARYQQFFLVRSVMKRIRKTNEHGARKGGIVWHTQGSGKSITMVMLVRALALAPELSDPRIVLVTDRKDLDRQLGNTFVACGLDKKRATSGRNLIKHIRDGAGIITTVINKFDKALSAEEHVDDSPDIFVLVDESHRTQFGSLAARMRKMLPKACYIGFTGTPLLKEEKNSFARFGGLIKPSYPMQQAVGDKAVVPLLYEGRHVELKQDQKTIDLWFDRHTEDLNDEQKADLKRKYSRAEMLNRADRVVYMRAFDVSAHYREHWQNTGFKAQLVAPGKETALKYHEYLNQLGVVSSEVVISPPDTREGNEDVGAGPTTAVGQFWERMMARYGSEEQYNRRIIEQFKEKKDPEILIVVDKLITGFDAPRNTVLYLCRTLREHTLLQAIARVNRLHEDKEYGYIVDYANVLEELDKALNKYDALAGFDEKDLKGILASIDEEAARLGQRYSALWDVFKEVKGSHDEESYEVLLADKKLRDDFYERLTAYQKTLAIALSSEKFIMRIDADELQRHKSDLKFFEKLRKSVRIRYAEVVDYRDYEPRIKKLLDTHIQADKVISLNAPVNILDESRFGKIGERDTAHERRTKASRADSIAYAIKNTTAENMEQDPVLYRKFSELIQQAIDDFRNRRITDAEYLQKVTDIRNQVESRQRDDVPETLRDDDEACAYFGEIKSCLEDVQMDSRLDDIAEKTARAVQDAINNHWKVDFWNDTDARKSVENAIDDFFYDDLQGRYGVNLSREKMDEMTARVMKVAKSRRPG